MHIYYSFQKYDVPKFKLSQPFIVLLALMSGSAHRAGGNLAMSAIVTFTWEKYARKCIL